MTGTTGLSEAGPYRTILADPPWGTTNLTGTASRHYALLSVAQLCRLPVQGLAAADAHLWLWVTNADLFEQIQVMAAWGFEYRGCLTWIKPRFGTGSYLRNQTEHLLLGVRGRAPVRFHGQGTWTYAPVQDHSHKPEEQYAIIERCSPGPYLELFARRKRPGWDTWGNEVANDVELGPGRSSASAGGLEPESLARGVEIA